ncbi:hypothetical protein [Pseudomonas syringae]|uniref:hypothetical protein n=1 Tax=Pseudomonas syringae TaxID=317 RepID=UPI001C7F9987|nr:hypothetical protein [Pseudomonas azotoformans]
MADLPETPEYPSGIYQIETSDPVLGGPGGIANRQAEQLAARTAWLKQIIDLLQKTEVAVTATKVQLNEMGLVVGTANLAAEDIPGLNWDKIQTGIPATLDGLGALEVAANHLIYGTGNDRFATAPLAAFMRGLLAKATASAALTELGGAPLDDPDFTGIPLAPTAAAGTRTRQLATTAFVLDTVRAPDLPNPVVPTFYNGFVDDGNSFCWSYDGSFFVTLDVTASRPVSASTITVLPPTSRPLKPMSGTGIWTQSSASDRGLFAWTLSTGGSLTLEFAVGTPTLTDSFRCRLSLVGHLSSVQ